MRTKMQSFAVNLHETGTVYVKDWDFFKQEGGLKQAWGIWWLRILAPVNDFECARSKGRDLYKKITKDCFPADYQGIRIALEKYILERKKKVHR